MKFAILRATSPRSRRQNVLAAKAAVALLGLTISCRVVCAQTAAFVPPPRTIADITAILDQEKPDRSRIAKLHADADAREPAHPDAVALSRFLYERAQARATLGRFQQAIA